MRPKQSFTVFTLGDSRKLATWSNVPYFFTRTLEAMGHTVERVDIGPNRFLRRAYDGVVGGLLRLFGSRVKHDYFRSPFYYYPTIWRIERKLRKYPEHLNLFLTFSFGHNRTGRPYVLFGDMTFEKHINYFEGRSAKRLELRNISREERNLRNASLVVSLFPELADELAFEYGSKVKYYGNVVNLETPKPDEQRLVTRKMAARELVFIGKPFYRDGLLSLLKAMVLLNDGRGGPVHLNVIGISEKQMGGYQQENVTFHGYLDKDVPEERARYLDILERSSLFVNPNPKWAAFSASCEAMYMFTPVIVLPYPEFTRTFGEEDSVGHLLRSQDPEELAQRITGFLDDRVNWLQVARKAHAAVASFTWEAYVTKFLADVASIGDQVQA